MKPYLCPELKAPHTFTRFPPQLVVSYPLVSTELGREHPEARLGFDWLASLSAVLRSEIGGSALATYLRDEVGIARPGQPSAPAVLNLPYATEVPRELLEAELPGIHGWYEREIQPLVSEIERA